jgi:hypothetical protein
MKFNLTNLLDIRKLIQELSVGLKRLDFTSNFQSFKTSAIISAGSTAKIRHGLDSIPTEYLIVNQEGNGLITRDPTTWTTEHAYMYNNGAVTVEITIIFFK